MAEMDDDLLIFTLSRLSISLREPIDNARKRLKIDRKTYILAKF